MQTGFSARQWAVVAVLLDGARAGALYVVSMLSYVRGEVDRTVEAVEESIAAALLGRGLTALSGGDLDAAEKPLRKALEMFREQDERSGASLGLAQVELARGAPGRAAALLAEAEGLSRSAGDWFTLTATLSSQALESRLHGDEARTAALLRESVGLAGNLGDAWHVVYGATGLAGVAAREGRAEHAVRLFGAVEALCETMGVDVPSLAWRALNERDLAGAREQLDAGAFDAAWAESRAMTLEEVVAEALAEST